MLFSTASIVDWHVAMFKKRSFIKFVRIFPKFSPHKQVEKGRKRKHRDLEQPDDGQGWQIPQMMPVGGDLEAGQPSTAAGGIKIHPTALIIAAFSLRQLSFATEIVTQLCKHSRSYVRTQPQILTSALVLVLMDPPIAGKISLERYFSVCRRRKGRSFSSGTQKGPKETSRRNSEAGCFCAGLQEIQIRKAAGQELSSTLARSLAACHYL